MPVLVDSSLWVHYLRRSGDPVQRERISALLQGGEAAWCPVVRLELWRGVTNDGERKVLREFEAVLPDYPVTPAAWGHAIRLADAARRAGVTLPLADLLVHGCARVHGVRIAHDDEHFATMGRLDR